MFAGAKSADPDVSNWNTSNVVNMKSMFNGATKANPKVSNWNTSNVTDMWSVFRQSGIVKADLSKWKLNAKILNNLDKSKEMFKGCSKLEYLKTPTGLATQVSGAGNNFKIVKLKKGSPVSIEKESQNLDAEYTINQSGDKQAVYHIYRKDKYAGVTFDKNSGDNEAWVNHEIVEKDKTFNAGGGNLPAENPKKAGHTFLGPAGDRKSVV